MGDKYIKPTLNKGSIVSLPSEDEIVKSDIDYPVFCFKHLHQKHDIQSCTKDEKVALLNKMSLLSQLTWDQIQLAPKHGLGTEKISRKSIKASIPAFITSDVNHFFAFRFKGKAPFIGHKSGSIFHIIYIDRDFTVYNH
jgi:hypothetical protein